VIRFGAQLLPSPLWPISEQIQIGLIFTEFEDQVGLRGRTHSDIANLLTAGGCVASL
jgi:hypothetical protein